MLNWLLNPQNSNAIVACAAVAYTLLTALILHATRQTMKATKDILEAAHRPYLGVVLVEINPVNQGQSELSAHIRNVGAAPGRDVEIDLQVSYNGSVIGDRPAREIALLPGQTHVVTVAVGIALYPPPNLIVSVEISYQGMTKKSYRTETACRYAGAGKPFSIVSATLK